MKKQRDSVAKGGSSVALARIFGMAFSFLLFLLLARHSAEDAAVFRTVVTYIVVAEFLGMLGLHRWLATEIAPEHVQRWTLFLSTNIFTLGVTLLLSLSYVLIAKSGMYADDFNQAIYLGALAVIPSGIYACVQSSLVGIGRSHLLGKLNMAENIIRCMVSIALIYLNQPVIFIIWVFVATRWLVAIYGFMQLKQQFKVEEAHQTWQPDAKILADISKEAPKFALIIAAFLVLRNAGLLILPALSTAIETANYGVGYQLLDLILVIPSVLATTSTHVFANKAIASQAALKKASIQLISITSLALFPLIAITAGFAQQFLHMLYGDKYLHGQSALMILMVTAGFMMIDQVLSQIMQAKKAYHQDMNAIVSGAFAALLFTLILTTNFGAIGTAFALLIGITFTVTVRLIQLNKVFTVKLLLISLWKQTLASLIIFTCIYVGAAWSFLSPLYQTSYLWVVCIPVALGLYGCIIYFLGCLKPSQIYRMRQFLFHH